MEQRVNKYKYSQIENHKEFLELAHIRRKAVVVNIIILLVIFALLYFIFGLGLPSVKVYPTILLLTIILMVNIGFNHIDYDRYNNLKIVMYVTIIGLYTAANMLIVGFETPSIFTSLFLTYAIVSIYQDLKGMILSSWLLFLSGFFLVTRFDDIFRVTVDDKPDTLYIQIFLLIFVLLLTLSSYILIKRKTFFYNQLAIIKEAEIRNISLMQKMQEFKTKKSLDFSSYYKDLQVFNKKLSEKIGVADIFSRQLSILKDLEEHSLKVVVEKYPDYSQEEIEHLQQLVLKTNHKITNLAVKASKSSNIEIDKKEIFSESQFKTFKHFKDSTYTKIITFAVFYSLLKIDKPYLDKLDDLTIMEHLYHSEFYYKVDPEIFKIYMDNKEVFDAIIQDHLEGGWIR